MTQRKTAFALRCAALPVVHIGMVGVGHRGQATMERYRFVEGAEICALADLSPQALAAAQQLLPAPLPSRDIFCGDDAWKDICQHPDLDLIYICTDWDSHTAIAVEAMRCGKHVAVEVPAATTIEECWWLVRTAEETQRHCFMTENCCYDWFSLATRELYRQGFFGTVTHCEGAYIHDWRDHFERVGTVSAGYREGCRRGGNPYPTHAIGPIAQLLGFHREDQMLSLVSMTGQADGVDSLLGHVSSALISTARGVTILLQFDGTTPRPYSRIQAICGTKAFAQKYPVPVLKTDLEELHAAEAEHRLLSLTESPAFALWKEGTARGVPNAMNYAMDCRLIHCLRQGLPLDMDVYDAAEWSCLTELTRLSAQQGGAPVSIPDFRQGDYSYPCCS